MAWVKAKLRDQVVFARAKDDGSFAPENGKVEIRYKPNDGRRYDAKEGNLARVGGDLLADDACGPAGASPRKDDAAKKESAKIAIPKMTADFWIVYADGACSGNPGPAGLGVVMVAPGGKIVEGYEYLGEGTNNVAELSAILRALEAVPADAPVAVHTDSQYAIGVLSKAWKAKANQELIAKIKVAIKRHTGPLRWVYVPGHAGVPLNERADELAREAVTSRGSQKLV